MITNQQIARLRARLQAAPRTPIPRGEARIPDPAAWKPRDSVLQEVLGDLLDLQSQISAAMPVVDPEHRIYLTKNADDPYGGDLQAAIDACINPTVTDPWVVEILSPGEYEGNFVLPDYVYLTAVAPGTTPVVVLRSSSGNTLTVPDSNCGVSNIVVLSDSASPTDAALSVEPTTETPGDSLRLVMLTLRGLGSAPGLRTQLGSGLSGPITLIYVDANGEAVPYLIDLLGAGIVVNLGGSTNFNAAGTTIHAANGSFSLLFEMVLQNTSGGTGWLIEADTGATVYVFQTNTIISANGFKGLTGAFLGLLNLDILLPPSGTLLELDAASFAGLGNVQIATGANPYDLIVAPVPGNVFFTENLDYREGLLAGRPTTPRPGMRYYATDQPAGARQLTFVASVGWVDQTDTVVP